LIGFIVTLVLSRYLVNLSIRKAKRDSKFSYDYKKKHVRAFTILL